MPGQDLDQVFERMSGQEIERLLDEDVVANLKVIASSVDLNEAMKRIAASQIYNSPERAFSNDAIRGLIYENVASDKLDELAGRLRLASRKKLDELDPTQNLDTWQTYAGFFGLDTRGPVTSAPPFDIGDCAPNFGLFDHQRKAARQVLGHLEGGHGRVVLHMPTGAGKTRTAMHIASDFLHTFDPGVIVWLANSRELLEQACEAFENAWAALGNRTLQIYRFWGDHNPDISELEDGILVAGFQKLHALSVNDPAALLRLGNKTKLTIVDESHQAIATTYADSINKISRVGQHSALLGLTATPGRTWSDIAADEELSEFFDNKKVILAVDGYDNVIDYLTDEGYLAKPKFNRIEYGKDEDAAAQIEKLFGKKADVEDSALEALAKNANRNAAIVQEVTRLVGEGHKRIIVFAANVQNAEILSSILNAIGLRSDVVTGETSQSKRARAIREFRRKTADAMILCNFGVLTTGFDAPQTSAAIIARPTKSLVLYSQMVGRAIRGPKAGGNAEAEVSTVVDTTLPGFGSVTEAFTNWEDVWD